ncbi:MAG: bifunctional demethylmenaquinone methyltransferase/2-methoxy-6-polyprenyl-1,4-benzoquinol methylase UbiE [Bacteroidetes bacterium]|nr:bifunctional demethylmenaquinone methyltransferase/2-methoxy-6-polyprenyl-1,4-benzoquinol methylase UbiE [Bacteroidota bacterium]
MPQKESVQTMFDEISGNYDFLNHFLSFGIDRLWRKRLVKEILKSNPSHVLDLATGTADLALELRRKGGLRITGVDISENMMAIGRKKIAKAGLSDFIELQCGDAENLQFPDENFDAAMIAFGVRNFENLEKGIGEMHRVLKKSGKVMILEFSHPQAFPLKQFYGFYSRFIIPLIGRMISSHPSAYRYLPDTVAAFPSGMAFLDIMIRCGFTGCRYISLSGGIASIYSGTRPV